MSTSPWTPVEWQRWLEQLDEVERTAVAVLAATGIGFTPVEHRVLESAAAICRGCARSIPLPTLALHEGLCPPCWERNGGHDAQGS